MKSVMFMYGTRPEAIKLAPVIKLFEKSEKIKTVICSTGQHIDMLQQVHTDFEINPDVNLGVMKTGQSLNELTQNLLQRTDDYLQKCQPDLVIVHGDTTSALCSALSAFYLGIPVAHIEAGLRTADYRMPFPEEFNRRTIANIAELHFAPTENNQENLIAQHINKSKIFVTGNTAIDSLKFILKQLTVTDKKRIYANTFKRNYDKRKFIIITAHRRENLNGGIQDILTAITHLAETFPDIDFLFPVHPNPIIRNVLIDAGTLPQNLYLRDPINYTDFAVLLELCFLVMTDSGGIQEEAPSLSKPVVVLRSETERNEGVEAGTLVLTGTNVEKIVSVVENLINDESQYRKMMKCKNPYGDGLSSMRILRQVEQYLESI